MLTKNSSVKELYAHPVGRDILRKALLLVGKNDKLVRNPLISAIKLKLLPKLSGGKVSMGFIDALLEILNGEPDTPRKYDGNETPAWWKEAVFYQIYPRSFKDSNGDGIGDLRGITEKLDYLKELGVDAIWLSPVYDSPNDDNGYDIRDYRKIMAEFGTMEDFDELLEGVHTRGMRLIMDLVVNHTSDEHEWFKKAVAEPDSKYGDYYIFRDEPNNWNSFFSGSAWRWIEERGQYALHLFSNKQMDLNWENPDVRHEVKELVRWWLEKGVDGFRMDVINYISKRPGLPDGDKLIGVLTNFTGMEHYYYGPRLHEYLRELKSRAFSPYNAFTVGETPGIGMEMSKLLTADYREELDMVFSFDQLETPGHIRFDDYKYDLNYYKEYITDWMENYGAHCRMALFYENHDNPRIVSKVNPDPQYRSVLAKLLATMLMTLKGTPFVFQGQELGMVNSDFSSMGELRDVESLNYYTELKKTMNEKDAFKKILAGSRDHARVPMQWTPGANAGFSEAEPWIDGGRDCEACNAAVQAEDKDSVLNYHRELISLRKKHAALIYGDISIVNKNEKDLFTYWRTDGNESFYIECNLGSAMKKRKDILPNASRILGNYSDAPEKLLRPYEAVVWRTDRNG
ncbi:MAG: alpha-glucosidase [Firmicutes bacterium HGW-Firmicutes-16]|nr:MAG: alpha-glucosidase [Firmicutes bacterium HGW-Firmicutes-16]